MSLKNIHIFFILASIALCAGVGFWALGEFRRRSLAEWAAFSAGSFIAAAGLCAYLVYFIRKSRSMNLK